MNLPKIELQTPHDLSKQISTDGKPKRLTGKIGFWIVAGISAIIGFVFTIIGLAQSDGCTAGIFVINRYREDHLNKSMDDEMV